MPNPYDFTPYSGRHVLVTGAAGFVGRHLVAQLKATGAGICVADLPDAAGFPPEFAGLRQELVDLADPVKVQALVASVKPDFIFHLAAMTDIARDWHKLRAALTVNVGVSVNLCEAACLQDPMPKMIILGTHEEYGDQIAPFEEKMQVRPVSPYSWSKVAVTNLAGMVNRTFGLPTIVLRPFLVYGPGQPPSSLIPSLITSLLEGKEFEMTAGEQTRDFVYIGDLVDAILLAGLKDKAVGEVINVCTGQDIQVRQVVKDIAVALGAEPLLKLGAVPYSKTEAMRIVGDPSKARKLLGFTPAMRLSDGIRTTVDWFRERHGK